MEGYLIQNGLSPFTPEQKNTVHCSGMQNSEMEHSGMEYHAEPCISVQLTSFGLSPYRYILVTYFSFSVQCNPNKFSLVQSGYVQSRRAHCCTVVQYTNEAREVRHGAAPFCSVQFSAGQFRAVRFICLITYNSGLFHSALTGSFQFISGSSLQVSSFLFRSVQFTPNRFGSLLFCSILKHFCSVPIRSDPIRPDPFCCYVLFSSVQFSSE